MNSAYVLLVFSCVGFLVRFGFGVWNAKNENVFFDLNYSRVCYELVQSVFFGVIGALMLTSTMPSFSKLPLWLLGVIGGFFGADFFNMALKRNGFGKLSFDRLSFDSGSVLLSLPQKKALKFAVNGISNNDYQKIASVSDATATRHLSALVKKGLLRKVGENKGVKYFVVK